ncbi:hypothetical protein VKT23_016129 [Stygiomarasmius scandens]|uniref:Uncharacterized protein n=1 Tax=Marasmiellus scandens TaxID=2682957 RepID=A0ABR1J0D3_9AGAR
MPLNRTSRLHSRHSMRNKSSGGVHSLSNLSHHGSDQPYHISGNVAHIAKNGNGSHVRGGSSEELETKIQVTQSVVTTWDRSA